jgi:hypothetical protein
VSDARGLRRRAEHLLALANKARDDNYTQLADYILDRANQLFEEARIRELEPSRDEARRIAADISKLPDLIRQPTGS